MHAGFCLISFVMVFFLYPETMGVPLEEMGEFEGPSQSAKADPFFVDALFGDSSSRDLEAASLVHSRNDNGSTEPPTLAKRASEAHAHLPPNSSASPGAWSSLKSWFSGSTKGKGNGPQGVANYQSVRSGETDDEQ